MAAVRSATPFELTGPLPGPGSAVVLEASAGTGKTFALAGLVTRYLAGGVAGLDEMLLITFGREASRELRERVREQIGTAVGVLEGHRAPANDLEAYLLDAAPEIRQARCGRLRAALADFDAATIVTIHQFCSLVLKSLGLAGDTDATVTLVEDLSDLVTEVVDDHYLTRFSGIGTEDEPVLTRAEAIKAATHAVADPSAERHPLDPDPASPDGVRMEFLAGVLEEFEHRKRHLGVQGYNDLLTRLRDALVRPDSDAAHRMRRRWRLVMVDEFQDTDPVQWQVIDSAFRGHSTLILVGDPKQAIYGFRGGDVYTYLAAARGADDQRTLDTNWRSDEVLVDSLQVVLADARLGHPEIVVPSVRAHRTGHRLSDAPRNAPFRLRVVERPTLGCPDRKTIGIDLLREHIPADLATDIATLLNSSARYDGRTVRPGDIAVIVDAHKDARACRDALTAQGIPVVYTGDSDVFASQAAEDWLYLLEAFDQPNRTGLVRAVACTMFFGETAETLGSGGDRLTDRVGQTLREWVEHARRHGIAAVFEAAQLAGMGRRVLSQRNGERHMTDLAHIGQLLQQVAHDDRLDLPGLRDWLRRQCTEGSSGAERVRRLDSDAGAVQIMTVFVAKGLQFPIVYLPFLFNRHVWEDGALLYHAPGPDNTERRCLYLGEEGNRERKEATDLHRREAARDHLRMTYVALTRAQSQVVAWWAPSWDEPNGGLSRLLRGRRPGDTEVPFRCPAKPTDGEARAALALWQEAGGLVLEDSVVTDEPPPPQPEAPAEFAVRHFHRRIDTRWRRTSYSGLTRAAEEAGVRSEPEVGVRDDEPDFAAVEPPAEDESPPEPGERTASPMAGMPAGAVFGSLVHAVLETADPLAADLPAELAAQARAHERWWPVDVAPETLAAALVPLHETPLGPLADGLTLRHIGRPDRLCELDFEIPLSGGDAPDTPGKAPPGVRVDVPAATVADIGALLREHLEPDDPFVGYADRLASEQLGGQSLLGYLSGSVDVVLRLPGPRYLVVDYKTNHLGDAAEDYDRARLAAAMIRSDYPLQALLYSAVLHRFLRWRQPDYSPDRHLAGVQYLFLRGMCGPDTPVIDGHPAGVFGWRPPASLIVALSDVLHGGRAAS